MLGRKLRIASSAHQRLTAAFAMKMKMRRTPRSRPRSTHHSALAAAATRRLALVPNQHLGSSPRERPAAAQADLANQWTKDAAKLPNRVWSRTSPGGLPVKGSNFTLTAKMSYHSYGETADKDCSLTWSEIYSVARPIYEGKRVIHTVPANTWFRGRGVLQEPSAAIHNRRALARLRTRTDTTYTHIDRDGRRAGGDGRIPSCPNHHRCGADRWMRTPAVHILKDTPEIPSELLPWFDPIVFYGLSRRSTPTRRGASSISHAPKYSIPCLLYYGNIRLA